MARGSSFCAATKRSGYDNPVNITSEAWTWSTAVFLRRHRVQRLENQPALRKVPANTLFWKQAVYRLLASLLEYGQATKAVGIEHAQSVVVVQVAYLRTEMYARKTENIAMGEQCDNVSLTLWFPLLIRCALGTTSLSSFANCFSLLEGSRLVVTHTFGSLTPACAYSSSMELLSLDVSSSSNST